MKHLQRERPGYTYFAGAPLLIAHRGGAKLAPENTMEAFRSAVETWKADILETDARLTQDGRVVLIHDAATDRTCDRSGEINQMKWAEIKDLDAGYHFRDLRNQNSFRGQGVRIPLMEEALETFPNMRINVEAKCPKVAEPLVEIIRRQNAEDRVLLAAKIESDRKKIGSYSGPLGASRRDIAYFWAARHARLLPYFRPTFDALQVPEVWNGIRVVTPDFVKEAHRLNIPVHVWVVDREEDIRRLLSWGVDGIQTDRLDILSRVLKVVVNNRFSHAT
ncbi:MAG TPA: glycerophosphodiester phosphodiesterase [Gemmatimonadetes bacterium]|nr:glycerophosphodiester phosphodiesterase [Gemmatimonadota bacterium]